MRLLSSMLVTAVAVTAQSPLTTTFANNNGGAVGGVVMCDLAVSDDATITDVDLNLGSAAGTVGSIDVYTAVSSFGSETTPADWTLVASGAVTAAGAGSPSNFVLSTPLTITSGNSIGIAFVANGVAHAYTTGTSPFPLVYSTCPMTLTANGGSNVPFAGSFFTPRVINTNIHFTTPGCTSIALADVQGDGCGGSLSSFYELVDAAGIDLSGSIITGTANGSGFDISVGPGAGFTVPAGAAQLVGIGDDAVVDSATVGGTLGMFIGSNGWMATGAGNSNQWSPSAGLFTNNPSAAAYAWTDLQPNAAGSGGVYYDEVGTVARVTYDGAFGWGTTDPNFIQITIDSATGDFSIEFGAVGAGNPENWLIGYAPGGPVADGGSIDISAEAPFSIATTDTLDLELVAVGTPIQGASASDFQVTTNNIPGSALSHFGIVGLSRPGVDLTGLGLPGCFLHASGDILDLVLIPPATSPSYTWTALTIPAGPVFFDGFVFNVQSAIFGTGANNYLGLGAITSNGIKATVGQQ